MRVLFIHRSGPGQFLHLARHLADRGDGVTLLCERVDRPLGDVRVLLHGTEAPARARTATGAAVDYHVRLGERVAVAIDRMVRREGPPDVVVGHAGWGSLLFVKDVLPATPALAYCEYYYRPSGADMGFDPADPVTAEDRRRLRARNLAQTATLSAVEAGLSPTRWQRDLYPAEYRPKIGLCHDGIDTDVCRPDPTARFTLPDGRVLDRTAPVVTFAARDLEPYRGFPQFMRAAAKVAARHPAATFVVAGGDGVSYGRKAPDGRSWRAVMLEETGIDPSRIHFVGTLPHADLIRLFQVTTAHVYFTYPFVLSWSMLEAMATGALVVGSATAPVEEFVADGRNGLLAGFFDPDALADQLMEVLARPAAFDGLRAEARRTVQARADLATSLARLTGGIERLAGRRPRGFAAAAE
ncbi:glycosyltransferase [Mongoliimonas terrestris]|uniref:glycosyltransferase n=1 Tax=Mongoliimonas terrestris TaxID=1709001 RepID=UPI0009496F4F|nr:glycosyltransferase [Mongoliimonas terrestris]